MWAQFDTSSAFPTREWRAGDVVLGRYDMPIDNRVQPGKYDVALGIYDRATLKKLSVSGGTVGRDEVHLDAVKVAGTRPVDMAAAQPLNVQLGQDIELLGYQLTRPGPAAGGFDLALNLYWRALSAPARDYTVFVQLLGPDGRPVAQSDSQPASGRFPTSYWEPGETIADAHELKLDRQLPPGRYKLIAGMYLLATSQRLAAADGGEYVLIKDLEAQP